MEGKELYNEDEELDPKSKKEEEDGDDFGLPEIEDSEEKSEKLDDPYPESWEEKKEEEESFDYSKTNEELASDSDDIEPDYSYDEEDTDATENEYRSSYYDEEYGQKKLPVGWIIFAVIFLIAIIIGVFWWLNREEPQPTVTRTVVEKPVVQEPVVKEEPVVQEPEPEPEPVTQAGVFEINAPIGRYHVIVASSIDKDLVHDYGEKLAKEGMTCNILAPLGNKKFHRLSVANYASLNDAAIRSEELKHTLGEDVWVIRY